MRKNITKQIIDYVIKFDYDSIPDKVIEYSKYIILDTIGAILAASNPKYPVSRIISEFIREQGGKEEATIIGNDFKTSSTNAALANGILAYLCDIESHHVKAVLHEAAVLLPSALAIAERENAGGKDVITSFILGIDIETRVALAMSPMGMYSRGFHPSAIVGCIGSTITAGKILGLKHEEFINAFGLAGIQASTLLSWESDKTEMSRPFGIGIAARNGITAALLAQKGFSGPEVLEGKYTMFNAFSGYSDYHELLKGLGKRFEVMNLAIKQYSCCSFTHPCLDALLKIMDENKINADEIKEINVRFPTRGAKLIDRSELKSHNIQYILSVGAYKKQVIIDDILFEQKDAKILDLTKRVKLIYDDELDKFFPSKMPTICKVKTYDRRVFEDRVDYAKGTLENPMTHNEIREKFAKIVNTNINEDLAGVIIEKVIDLEKVREINEIMDLLRFKQ